MAYHTIETIEGIGTTYGRLLRAAGIPDTRRLLDACCTAEGRRRLARSIGVQERKLLRWTHIADLLRVDGIGPDDAELLERAGVDTVTTLRRREADELVSRMAEVKALRGHPTELPPVTVVRTWVAESKTIVARIQR